MRFSPHPQAGEGSQPQVLTYLALGDSYTTGEGVPEEDRWPVRLAASLRDEGVPLSEPTILATTGWTTDELSAAMDDTCFAPPYALVSLLIGVNNQYRGRTCDNYREEFRALLQRAAALAGNRTQRVLVVSIPDWGATSFARASGRDSVRIAVDIDAYNAVARDETQRTGAHWVDITPISRRHADLLAVDGLHPSAAQYALWAATALPVAQAILANESSN